LALRAAIVSVMECGSPREVRGSMSPHGEGASQRPQAACNAAES